LNKIKILFKTGRSNEGLCHPASGYPMDAGPAVDVLFAGLCAVSDAHNSRIHVSTNHPLGNTHPDKPVSSDLSSFL